MQSTIVRMAMILLLLGAMSWPSHGQEGKKLATGTVQSLEVSGAVTMAQPPQNDAPSYEDTVHYIQERLRFGLEEKSHGHFVYHVNGSDYYFDTGDLSPHVSWANDNLTGTINCSGGAKCVHITTTSNGDGAMDTWEFYLKPDTDKSKMEKALLHLLDLCGVRPAKPDLF